MGQNPMMVDGIPSSCDLALIFLHYAWMSLCYSYSSDLLAMRQRAGPSSTYNFHQVKQHVEAGAGRVFCVVGGPGEGKSTLAAMMVENAVDETGFIHASHFCKRADTNRQVICTASQLTLWFATIVHSLPHACVRLFSAL